MFSPIVLAPMKRNAIKREVDFQILSDWIEKESRVLDLGCGRGILLEHLTTQKHIYGVGVDNDFSKIVSCVKRGVSAYQGDIGSVLSLYPDDYFDWIICSRTLHELSEPKRIIDEALRVGKHLAIGFINQAFWLNRLSMLVRGRRVMNEVYPKHWYDSRANNAVSVNDFEEFCQSHSIKVNRKAYLGADWKTPCSTLPNLLAGYAIYEVSH